MLETEMYNVMSAHTVSKDLNDLTFTDYFYRLMLLARSVFKWEGLPNGIDEKWIERYLFMYGRCMFFKDPDKGFMVAKCADNGKLNYYDEPTGLTPIATNYTFNSPTLTNYTEAVEIRNNDDRIATRHTILLYAARLAEVTRTIDVNVTAQQTPTLITGTDKQRLSLKQVYKQWRGHEPVIFGDKALETSPLTVLKTDAPYVVDKLQDYKHDLWNEVMTFLGINNANMDKRERLVADEVSANDAQIEQSAQVMLKSRERACEQINALFGTNIRVSLRNPVEIAEMESEDSESEVDNDDQG